MITEPWHDYAAAITPLENYAVASYLGDKLRYRLVLYKEAYEHIPLASGLNAYAMIPFMHYLEQHSAQL